MQVHCITAQAAVRVFRAHLYLSFLPMHWNMPIWHQLPPCQVAGENTCQFWITSVPLSLKEAWKKFLPPERIIKNPSRNTKQNIEYKHKMIKHNMKTIQDKTKRPKTTETNWEPNPIQLSCWCSHNASFPQGKGTIFPLPWLPSTNSRMHHVPHWHGCNSTGKLDRIRPWDNRDRKKTPNPNTIWTTLLRGEIINQNSCA